jgi:hypothetical protein
MNGNEKLRTRKFLTGILAAGALVGVYCIATAGISTVLMAATDSSAQARGSHGGGHGHWGGGRGHWGGGRYWGGRGRYWHGRWWGPGIGPCWRWTPVGWIWVC